ncbi:hypothetical protein [Vibrio sp. TBV020]|uniref:hypothetical protein n=1 Tax=Vibrio sp. TBV020 TaxID=3137398 RepID=UPI0038CDA8F5
MKRFFLIITSIFWSAVFFISGCKKKAIKNIYDINSLSPNDILLKMEISERYGLKVLGGIDPFLFENTKYFCLGSLNFELLFFCFKRHFKNDYSKFELFEREHSYINNDTLSLPELQDKIDKKRKNNEEYRGFLITGKPIIFDLISSDDDFTYVKQNHGIFDTINAIHKSVHSADVNLTNDQKISLVLRAYKEVFPDWAISRNWSHEGLYFEWLESFLYSSSGYYQAISSVGGEHHEINSKSKDNMVDALSLIGVNGGVYYNGLEGKDIVYKGEFIRLIESINVNYDFVIIVGPKELNYLFQNGLFKGEMVDVPEYSAASEREKIVDRVVKHIGSQSGNGIILYQCGMLASIFSYKIHKMQLGVSQLDLGLSLGALSPEFAGRFPWYSKFGDELERLYNT